jgi:hypothetical protein
MKLILNKSSLKENSVQLMRAAGYIFKRGIVGEEMSFERPLETSGFPKFHIYLTEDQNNIYLNLHLDQKRPSYAGTSAHSGEYDGDLLAEEIDRIKRLAN